MLIWGCGFLMIIRNARIVLGFFSLKVLLVRLASLFVMRESKGFGFITYADPSVVDKVIVDNHIINGKQVEIKRTIPKGAGQSGGFKTKKLFVGGLPSTVTEDEFHGFFSKYGKVVAHQIIRDRETNRSRGFGFIIFENEEVVDEILSKGHIIDMEGTRVSLVPWSPRY
ncbi:hypothetical protein RHSIM_Rhsim06G0231900 [Rhododendron simsii]|uniref:RRM domain-containing protein n=1 Tax=Rhododendron simsii TaxID=118357 RepID=A0A834GVQ1_RHOSS|nr:hypothetical protein RHSIM_Rhsim06G0231900 [Rhododendron simsii]